MSAEPWTSKHKPLSRREIVGNRNAVRRVYEWLRGWDKDRKAILLHGPPGVGKTASIEAVARELGYDVLEMNASDVRTEDRINEYLRPVVSSKTLGERRRLILFDEVDGIYARSDSGGLRAIMEIIAERAVPVAMTANDPWRRNLRTLRNKVEMVEFRRVSPSEVVKSLRRMCDLEGVSAGDTSLLRLAEASGGDVRSAIEDLQTSSIAGDLEEDTLIPLGVRRREEKLFETLRGIFDASTVIDAKRSIDMSTEKFEDIFEWVYEYLPTVIGRIENLSTALDYMGKADVIFQRIKRTNDWSQLPYFLELFTAGAALSMSSTRVSRYYRRMPDRLRNRWRYFNTSRRLTYSGLILSRMLHCSIHRARVDVLPIYRLAARSKGAKVISQALREMGVNLES